MKNIFTLLLLLFSFQLISQNSSDIYSKVQKLNVLGSLLHVGAHPDDENTNLISYFSNKYHIETTYLSVTRGDGGQNRIGTELTDALGLIRTQELLAARKIDGANQLFTTANDFGFSKHPDETLNIWDKKELLSQIVKHIRTIQPDIIINRFDHRTPGTTHGHHTSSAILSHKAFDLSSNIDYLPEQLKSLSVWSPKRLFFNTSWFFYGSKENFLKIEKDNFLKFDQSEFNTLSGLTYDQVAAKSRSQHKSQGFGRSPNPGGPQWGYMELIKGEPVSSNNPFEGINISWNRLKGGDVIESLVNKLLSGFDFKIPEKNVSDLINIYKNIENLENGYWKSLKLDEVKKIISLCLGLNIQLNSKNIIGTPKSKEKFNLKIVNPSNIKILIKSLKHNNIDYIINTTIVNNNLFEKELNITTDNQISSPYWLTEKGSLGMYQVNNEELKGLPETPIAIKTQLKLEINGTELNLIIGAYNRFTDPVKGEVITPYTIVPKVTVKLNQPVYLFSDSKPKQIPVSITAHENNIKGTLSLEIPKGWSIEPSQYSIDILKRNQQENYLFKVYSDTKNSSGIIKPIIKSNNIEYYNQLTTIDYPHIPKQFLVKPSFAKVFRIDLKNNINKIGYLMGVGDKIPEALENIGIQVVNIDRSNIILENLLSFKTIVIGTRAFNVIDELSFKNEVLWEYVKNGGTLVIQYNTSRGLKTANITPYKLVLSRDRVTDENSKVNLLNKTHSIFNYPNKIENDDFRNWVQERGLYFPNSWDDNFEPLIEMNDINETKKRGSLLVASYGEGKIIYTGLSFFRELPAGVPGAYRLFLNLINYGHE